MKAFLREDAVVDYPKIPPIAPKISKIYNKVVGYITSADESQMPAPSAGVGEGIGRRIGTMPLEDAKVGIAEQLKIRGQMEDCTQ